MRFDKVNEIVKIIRDNIELTDCWTCERSVRTFDNKDKYCPYDKCEGYIINEGFAKNIAEQIINIL